VEFYLRTAFLCGGGFPDAYINDPISIGRKALTDLSHEVELPNAINELESILNTNTNYAHQAILNEAKDNRNVVVNGETFQDLKANPKYSPSGSATIEEIETVLKKEQIQMMRSRASGLPTGSATVANANARAAAAATKKPLIQPDKADFLPQQMVNGRSVNKVPSAMSVEELVDRRAKVYDKLLDPEYSNVHPSSTGTGAMHNVDRGTIGHIDTELAKRGEDISMLPDAPAYDPDYVPGSGKRAPYLRSKIDEPAAQSEVIIAGASDTAAAASAAATMEADNLASTVTAAASTRSAAPAGAVAEAVVAGGSVTAVTAAATKASNGILNIGKKIISKPKNMAAVGVAVAAGAIAFRSN
jgi:hypothetical protein